MLKVVTSLKKYIKNGDCAEKLTISRASNYANEKWGIEVKVATLRSAVYGERLKAHKEKIGLYTIERGDLEVWLRKTNRVANKIDKK